MKRILIGIAILALALPAAHGARKEKVQEKPWTGCPGSEAMTVFQDVSAAGRKDRAATNMTERHRQMAARGWSFAGLAVYTENGDLEGFFLTYTRPSACAAESVPISE